MSDKNPKEDDLEEVEQKSFLDKMLLFISQNVILVTITISIIFISVVIINYLSSQEITDSKKRADILSSYLLKNDGAARFFPSLIKGNLRELYSDDSYLNDKGFYEETARIIAALIVAYKSSKSSIEEIERIIKVNKIDAFKKNVLKVYLYVLKNKNLKRKNDEFLENTTLLDEKELTDSQKRFFKNFYKEMKLLLYINKKNYTKALQISEEIITDKTYEKKRKEYIKKIQKALVFKVKMDKLKRS